ncbi:MAG: hypothetical protein Q7Q71_10175 [Verrucomicrobiota bacterium JB023]|nr:hypothetical protein [Verrucomicrobiota bacterium JB023]
MARLAALGVLLVGFLFMAVALKGDWFTLPTGWEMRDGELQATTRDTPVTKYFKLGLLVSLFIWFLVGVTVFIRRDWRQLLGWSFLWSMAILPLIWWYPQWVTVQDAETSGDAAWLQQQHDNLTWLGGDVFRAHSERYNEIQLGVNMQDPPIYLAAFSTPMDSLTSLGIEEIPEVIWWFGLNPAFSQFVGRGWFMAWMGAAAIGMGAFGLLKGLPDKGRRKLLKNASFVLAASSAILVISALFPVLRASSHLRSAKDAALGGRYQVCLDHLASADRWMPALRYDTTLILQRGRIETLLGQSDPCALIYQIWKLENEGYGARAKELLADLDRRREELPREWQRELARTWMRVSIDDFNSGRLPQAYGQFERICHEEPVAIQARFHHQLCCLQTGDIEGNRLRQAEIEQLYGPYLRKDKRGVLATSWLILAQGEWNAGNALAAAEARRQSKGL